MTTWVGRVESKGGRVPLWCPPARGVVGGRSAGRRARCRRIPVSGGRHRWSVGGGGGGYGEDCDGLENSGVGMRNRTAGDGGRGRMAWHPTASKAHPKGNAWGRGGGATSVTVA